MARVARGASHLLQAGSSCPPQFTRVPLAQRFAGALLTCSTTSGNILCPSPACPGLTQHIRWTSGESMRWLWPVHKEIYVYDAGERHGTRKATVCATFNTSKPVKKSQFAEALLHTHRRLPNLRAVLRQNGENLWYCEPSLPAMDFEVLEDEEDLLDLCIKATDVPFSHNDTMFWRVKLIPRGEHVPCPVPHIKAAFPHQYDLIFRAHHAVGDGQDGAIILQCIFDALNSVLSGRPVDDKEWGDLDDKQDVQILKEKAKENLMKDRKRFEEVKSTLPPPDTTPLLLQIFPRPNVTESITRYVERDMDPEILKHFLKNVQAAGVSFNTSFSAVMNTALVEMAKQAGLVQDKYTVTGNHLVSLRGLIKQTSRFRIGPYTGRLSLTSHVNQDVKSHFWKYCQELHQEFRSSLKSGLGVEQDAVNQLTHPASPDDYFTKQQPIHHDYTINNLGVISNSPYESYDHVQMTRLLTYNVVHSFYHYNMHQLIIFRDQCCYTLAYDTQYLSKETANLFADKIQSVIADVAKSY